MSLDACSRDWQHCLYCCGGHEYAPTGVVDEGAELEAGVENKGLEFVGVGAMNGEIACATGLATDMVQNVAKNA